MKINSQNAETGPAAFYSDDFRVTLHSHIPKLKSSTETTTLNVEPLEGYKYVGDFYGLLQYKNIPMHYHWLIMMMNGMISPCDYDGETLTFILPNFMEVERIYTTYRSHLKLKT